MSPITKKLIVIVEGLVILAVSAVVVYYLLTALGSGLGLLVIGLLWGLLGYMVYRKKNAPPNEIIPDDTTT